MNAPPRSDAYLLPDDAQKVTYAEDTKIPNAGKFTILREDHTVGNLVRMQLLRDPNVRFSGYLHPHPLINDIHIRVQTNDNSSPIKALGSSLEDLCTEFEELSQRFKKTVEDHKNSQDVSGFS